MEIKGERKGQDHQKERKREAKPKEGTGKRRNQRKGGRHGQGTEKEKERESQSRISTKMGKVFSQI